MRVNRLLLPAAVLALVAAPAVAQLRPNRPSPRIQNLPKILVATPSPANSADSSAAVRIGDGLRRKMDDVAGRWFNTITREQMNDALFQYAYPADALLPPQAARMLGDQMQARFLVTSSITRTEGGRYSVQVRAIGLNDKAGYSTTVMQQPNQTLEALGETTARGLESAFRALEDARKCWNEQDTKPRDAIESARRALRQQPDHGLAAYCLGNIAKAQKAPQDSVLAAFEAGTRGDPQSLEVWSEALQLYQVRNDTAKTVDALQQMLRMAPTNQPLREQAFGLFIRYGRANAAKEVAEEGLAIDSTNGDLWDLKSNACLFLEDYRCAVDALEMVAMVDSARLDTAFYNKISAVAAQPPDTAALVKWASRGVQKYPDNATLLAHLVNAYTLAGPSDSALAAVQRLIAVDSGDLRPVLKTLVILAGEKRIDATIPLVDIVERLGDASDKQNTAQILVQQGSLPLLQQQPPELDPAVAMARRAVVLAPAGGQMAAFANYVLGVGTFLKLQALDPQIMEQKSCELAREALSLRTESEAAFQIGQASQPEGSAPYIQWLRAPNTVARIESQIKTFCV